MAYGVSGSGRRRRNRCLLMGLCAVLLVCILLAVVLGLTLNLSPASSDSLKTTIINKCEAFGRSGSDCEKIWRAFEGAFVGKDPCDVPPEAYDSLIDTETGDPTCNRMLFWSKTKDMVHAFTEKRTCLLTLENTLLGSAMDGLTWCGRNGSNETFTTGCPGWTECENNPVRSFWNRASAAVRTPDQCSPTLSRAARQWSFVLVAMETHFLALSFVINALRTGGTQEFAAAACGNVSVMLNGSIATPFSPTSIFASIEVKNLDPTKLSVLNILLVTKTTDTTTCADNGSLKELQKALDPQIKYSCKEVPQWKVQNCISNSDIPCGDCW